MWPHSHVDSQHHGSGFGPICAGMRILKGPRFRTLFCASPVSAGLSAVSSRNGVRSRLGARAEDSTIVQRPGISTLRSDEGAERRDLPHVRPEASRQRPSGLNIYACGICTAHHGFGVPADAQVCARRRRGIRRIVGDMQDSQHPGSQSYALRDILQGDGRRNRYEELVEEPGHSGDP